MSNARDFDPIHSFTAFGPFLRYLRRRVRLTQRDLSIAVGYSPAQISLLESGHRLPDPTTVAALFIPALDLGDRPELATHLLALTEIARGTGANQSLGYPGRGGAANVSEDQGRSVPVPPGPIHSNLPAPVLPVIGRQAELRIGRSLLLDPAVRLLTLVGPPGVGKTRLALQCAWDTQAAFTDGAHFVELATVAVASLVPGTIVQALGVRSAVARVGGEMDAVCQYLRNKEILLVLDNFEQILAGAQLVADLLAAAPRVKVVVTSREALHLYGEHEFPVPPLPLPDLDHLPQTEELAQVPSVALFVARARAVRPDFDLEASNGPAVATVCVRLDGLPLAIELAAAQSKLLAPHELAARLNGPDAQSGSNLGLLGGGPRNRPLRQQTLRSALDWSFHLLDPTEQELFARLGVFVGGFDLRAVTMIAGTRHEYPHRSIEEGLQCLLDKSLVQASVDEPRRFRLLETVREYALEQLGARAELDETRSRHANYFMALSEEVFPRLFEAGQGMWLATLHLEHDNLRIALRWACDSGAVEVGLRLGKALWWFWYRQGFLAEGRAWLDELLGLQWQESQLDQDLAALRAQVLNGAGAMAAEQHDYERAEAYHTEAVTLRRLIGDMRGLAVSLHNLALVARERGHYARALTLFEESLAFDRQTAMPHDLSLSLTNLGITALKVGDHRRAEEWLEEGLARARDSGDPWCLGFALQSLSDASLAMGNVRQARALAEESLAIFSEQGDMLYVIEVLKLLGEIARRTGDSEQARARLQEGLRLCRRLGDERLAAEFQCALDALPR